jgi:hypothetical protein
MKTFLFLIIVFSLGLFLFSKISEQHLSKESPLQKVLAGNEKTIGKLPGNMDSLNKAAQAILSGEKSEQLPPLSKSSEELIKNIKASQDQLDAVSN